MLAYVNTLDPGGNTYHDTGMIWGTRMISSAGIFADSPDTFASMPVARHIIFMSDGVIVTDSDTYSLYGIETLRAAGQRHRPTRDRPERPPQAALPDDLQPGEEHEHLDLGDRLRHGAERRQ